MSSDEDDYMSEAFLSKCEDTRPGLVPKHIARQHKQQAKQKELNEFNKIKPKKVLEKEKREEGLSKIIGAENKGFAMLQKMGFKPGMTLGKKGEGRSEPVPIEVKSGRSGLGHDTELYRKRTAVSAARILSVQKRQKLQENRQLDFRERQRTAFVEKRAERDLYKSQKVCEQLDAQKDIKEPSELFFWPAAYLQKSEPDVEEEGQEDEDDEESEDDPLTAAEKLEILTLYLRNVHVYCVWCGTSYNDKADMEGNCPGDTAEVHDD